jgi:hypothetical protein
MMNNSYHHSPVTVKLLVNSIYMLAGVGLSTIVLELGEVIG